MSHIRLLVWNLFHGRSVPGSGRDLSGEFAARLAGWEWDAALLQEVPPWWPAQLARAAGAQWRAALTSRNGALALRRAFARRWPDAIKSNGGGCNAILARTGITEHRFERLRTWPERRVAQLVRLQTGVCVVNFHASTDPALAQQELDRLCAHGLAFAGDAPLVIGGDLNLRAPLVADGSLTHIAERDVDHVFARGLHAATEAQRLDRRLQADRTRVELSDHVPLAVELSSG
jgi:endonuclease/exonuclease/phosphatase family metal-dependent hydrolase